MIFVVLHFGQLPACSMAWPIALDTVFSIRLAPESMPPCSEDSFPARTRTISGYAAEVEALLRLLADKDREELELLMQG
jgi:hypothetical protein